MARREILYVGGFNFNKMNASAVRVLENAKFFNHIGYNTKILGKINSSVDTGISISSIEKIEGADRKISFASSIEVIVHHIQSYPEPPVVIAYNYPPIALNKLVSYCKKYNIPFIADVTEWHGIDGRLTLMKAVRWLLTQWKFRCVLKRVDNMILATGYLRKMFSKKNILLLPFVTMDLQDSTMPQNPKRLFLYSGSPGLNFSKDRLDFIFKSLALLKQYTDNFVFHVVGLSETDIQDKDVNEDLRKLEDNVRFFGRVPHNTSIDLLKSADFVLFARDVNTVSSVGLPTKVFEAFKYNVPIITNNTSDLQYIITEKNGFLIDELCVDKFVKTLRKATEMSGVAYQTMKKEGKHNPFYYKSYLEPTISFFYQIDKA